jgi:hypothetical protein
MAESLELSMKSSDTSWQGREEAAKEEQKEQGNGGEEQGEAESQSRGSQEGQRG